ncbi:MAG: PEP-CTERM sorting domain-containing protein [Isosphaeraceae bacterium]|nr:PEP-CTERM sorting domain-containing protein [Isosphaeraceae bacterium]
MLSDVIPSPALHMEIPLRILLALAASLAFCTSSFAGNYLITAVGQFDSSTPSEFEVAAPDTTFYFSAEVAATVISGSPNAMTNVSYLLGGSPILATADLIVFYDAANNGLFDIVFSSGDFVSLYGPEIFDAGGELIPGVYNTTSVNVNALGGGSAVVTVTALSAVPEPSTIAGAGFAAVLGGLAAARRRRTV